MEDGPESQHEPRTFKITRKRVFLVVFGMCLVFVSMLALNLWWPFTIPIQIAKETTYITSPLDESGLPDYRQALNDMLKPKGVTPENNAAILLWQAIGPGEATDAWNENFSKAIGINPLPREGDYLIGLSKFAEVKETERLASSNDENEDETSLSSTIHKELENVEERPWKADDYPTYAEWLKLNEKPLQLVLQAVERSHYYQPIVSSAASNDEPDLLLASSLPAIQAQRDLARLFKTRAMLHLGEEETPAAQRDLIVIHKLARFSTKNPTVIGRLVGIAIDSSAYYGDQQLALHGELSPKELLDYRRQLATLPPICNMPQIIDNGERILLLDAVTQFGWGDAGNDPENVGYLFSKVDGPDGHPALEILIRQTSLDWNQVLRLINEYTDESVNASRLPRPLRAKAFQKIEDRLEKEYTENASERRIASVFLMNPRQRGRFIGVSFMRGMYRSMEKYMNAQDRSNTQWIVTLLTFSIQAYRKDNGSYPKTLAELFPKYSDHVPVDLFSGKPLFYKSDGQSFTLYSVGMNGKDDGGKTYGEGNDTDDITVKSPQKKLAPTSLEP